MLALLGRRWRWYQIFFAAIGFTIVYPDVVAAWVAERRNMSYTNGLIAVVFACGVACLIVFTALAESLDEQVDWSNGLISVGIFAFVRLFLAFFKMIFGFDRDL
jgi:hypothetical protein